MKHRDAGEKMKNNRMKNILWSVRLTEISPRFSLTFSSDCLTAGDRMPPKLLNERRSFFELFSSDAAILGRSENATGGRLRRDYSFSATVDAPLVLEGFRMNGRTAVAPF